MRFKTGPIRLAASIALVALFGGTPAFGTEPEDDLKSVIVLNFLRFSTWPGTSAAEEALTVGVLGRSSFTAALRRTTAGKAVNGHPVKVVEIKDSADAGSCQVVYFATERQAEVKAGLAAAVAARALTIGQSAGFLESGGAVRLFQDDDRMTFEVGLEALKHSGVEINSRLLRLGQLRRGLAN